MKMDKRNGEREFVTENLYLASLILFQTNIQPKFQIENGWISFIFPRTGETLKAVELFNNDGKVGVLKYGQAIKQLRSELLVRKNMINGGLNGK